QIKKTEFSGIVGKFTVELRKNRCLIPDVRRFAVIQHPQGINGVHFPPRQKSIASDPIYSTQKTIRGRALWLAKGKT
ncbi:MAG: hypothetical protein ACYCZA_14400, partial [Thiobacillus sp.]